MNNKQTNNKPEKVFRSGAVQATVWVNESEKDGSSEKFEYKTVSLDRSFKDKNGAWQKTNSFRMSDVPRAELVLRKAYEFSVLRENDSAGIPEVLRSEPERLR